MGRLTPSRRSGDEDMSRVIPLIWWSMIAILPAQVTDPAEVKSAADVAALDARVVAVSAYGLAEADAVAEALAKRGGLEEVKLRLCRSLTARGIQALLTIPELRRLDLSMCSQLTDEAVAPLSATGQLTALDLTMCPAVGDETLAAIIGHHPLESLSAGGTGSENSALGTRTARALIRKPTLRSLHLSACQPDAQAQRMLAGLKKLESLRLVQMKINAKAFARFGSSRTLRRMELVGVLIEGRAADVIGRVAGVERLQLMNVSGLKPKDLKILSRFKRLKSLSLSGEGLVGDRELLGLAKCAALDEIALGPGRVQTETIARLGGRDGLHAIELESTQLEGNFGVLVKRHRALARLSVVGGPSFGDDDLAALTAAPGLSELSLAYLNGVSDEGVKALSGWPALAKVTLEEMPRLTSACLPSLTEIDKLRELSLSYDHGWNPAAIRALKTARPEVRFSLD